MKRKLIVCSGLILALSCTSIPAFAVTSSEKGNMANTTPSMSFSDYKTEIQNIEKVISQDEDSSKETLSYMENAIGQNKMMMLINDYKDAYSREDDAYKMMTANLESTYQEVERNNFSEEQAKALFISAANLETGNAEESEMTFSSETPDFAPSHLADINSESKSIINNENSIGSTSVKATTDRSSRTSYETGGIGYEVLSTSGYNKSTAFLNAGSCNITAASGKAGYMFYTIYSNGHYQDIGIGYFGGQWKAFVSGYWTNWGTGTVSINSGDKLYFKLWIGTDNKIYFQILDGNDFNIIKFQNSYSTSSSPIPSSGSGVNFNRQITLVDTANNASSGLYLNNASFSQSYLYNNSSTQIFNGSNTNSTRRGKFGCSWASDNKVSILSNTRWDSETVSIKMQ